MSVLFGSLGRGSALFRGACQGAAENIAQHQKQKQQTKLYHKSPNSAVICQRKIPTGSIIHNEFNSLKEKYIRIIKSDTFFVNKNELLPAKLSLRPRMHSCCGSRKNLQTSAFLRFFRPRPLAYLASSATGSARFTPHLPKILLLRSNFRSVVD